MNCELGLYEGFPTIADLGFLISEIKEKHLCFLQNTEGYSSEIQHPISEIIVFIILRIQLVYNQAFGLYQIPEVTIQVFKYGYCSIHFLFWFSYDFDLLC